MKRTPLHRKSRLVAKRPIRRVSRVRGKQLREYAKARAIYMHQHSLCEILGCSVWSSQLHHRKGRVGKMLNDKRYWMALCWSHHSKIHDNPRWAMDHGYLLQKL